MIKKLFNNDNFLRVLSIVVAVFLWMYIVSLNNPQVEIPITGVDIKVINVENIEENGLDIINVSDKKTTVKVYGRMSEVSSVQADDITVYIDASDIYSANNYYLDTKSKIDSNSVVVSGIETKTVTLYVDYIQATSKTLDVLVIGEPKGDLALKEAVPEFDSVIIKGPSSILNKVSNVKATLDITNANADYLTVCPIKLYTANGEVINSEFLNFISDVSVDVKFKNVKTLKLELVTNESIDTEKYEMKILPESVEVAGSIEILNNLDKISIETPKNPEIDENNSFIVELPSIDGIEYISEVNNIKVELISKWYYSTNLLHTERMVLCVVYLDI